MGAGRYEIIRSLGKGATAETFLYRDQARGGDLVAQKLFYPAWSERRPDLIDREFQILADLHHPGIADVLDFGETEGRYFLVSEYVEGIPLAAAVQGQDLNTILWFFSQLLEVLDYLYFRNIVHLDLKPDNVLVEIATGKRNRRVRLLDFGLASFAAQFPSQEAIGTPPFTAPEFVLRRTIDCRSDLYSVGVMLYEALAGRSPFAGKDPVSLLNAQLQKNPPPLQSLVSIPEALSQYVDRLLARDPEQRYPNPRRALLALEATLGEFFQSVPISPLTPFEDPDFLLRESEFQEFLQKLETEGGWWWVEGAAGMGKSFLARWLQRQFWRRSLSVLRLAGEQIVLAQGDTNFSRSEAWVLIDDAEQGPVRPWLEARDYSNVVLFGKNFPPSLVGRPISRKNLLPLGPSELEPIWKKLSGRDASMSLEAWLEATGGIPFEVVQKGRQLLRQEALGGQGEEERLAEILSLSQIPLDLETLSAWIGRTVVETQEYLERMMAEGLMQREVQAGKVFFQAKRAPPIALPPHVSPSELIPLLEDCYKHGRYREGIEIGEKFLGEAFTSNPAWRLLKAKLLAGTHGYAEVFRLLSQEFLASLTPAQRALALETLGKSWLFSGESTKAKAALGEADRIYKELEDPAGRSRVLLHLGILAQRQGEAEQVESYYSQAWEEGSQAPQAQLLQGVAQLNWANWYYDRGDFSEVESRYRQSLELLLADQHGPAIAQAYLNWANLALLLGKQREAEHYAREALRWAIHYRFPLTQGYALLIFARIDERRGNFARQGERLDEAVQIFSEAELHYELIEAKISRAYFLESSRLLPAAEQEAREALKRAQDVLAPDLVAKAQLILGRILRQELQHRTEAQEFLAAAHRHFSQRKNPQLLWQVLLERGELEKGMGNVVEARRNFEEALVTVDQWLQGQPPATREILSRDRKREWIVRALKNLEGER